MEICLLIIGILSMIILKNRIHLGKIALQINLIIMANNVLIVQLLQIFISTLILGNVNHAMEITNTTPVKELA